MNKETLADILARAEKKLERLQEDTEAYKQQVFAIQELTKELGPVPRASKAKRKPRKQVAA